jgi:hypothetical protein
MIGTPFIIPGHVSRGHALQKDRGRVSGDGLGHRRLDEAVGDPLSCNAVYPQLHLQPGLGSREGEQAWLSLTGSNSHVE